MATMKSLSQNYRAVVAGAKGGIGSAFVRLLGNDERCSEVVELSRSGTLPIDFKDEETIRDAASNIEGEIHLFVDATGFLSDEIIKPEKSLRALSKPNMIKLFELNAAGPALLMKHFLPLFPRKERAIFATLSARVGSIEDNALGGWYSYRASKAALNMFVRCAAIEIGRTKPKSICVSLHPGTVATSLSEPFFNGRDRFSPEKACGMMLGTLDGLTAEQTGRFFDYHGKQIPW